MLVILPCSRGPTERSLLEGKACSSYCLVVMWPTRGIAIGQGVLMPCSHVAYREEFARGQGVLLILPCSHVAYREEFARGQCVLLILPCSHVAY